MAANVPRRVGPAWAGRQRPTGRLLGLLASTWGRLTAPDPGLVRLRSAARATLTVAATSAVLYGVATLAHAPPRSISLGVVLSLYVTFAVRDPQPRAQGVTLLLAPLLLGALFTVAALLVSLSPWADLLVVPLAFVAVGAPRSGPRAAALGMLPFRGGLLGLSPPPPPKTLPAELGFVALATAYAFAVRFVLWPERPAATLRHVLASFNRQAAEALEAVSAALAGGSGKALRSRVRRLNDTALAAGQQLDRFGAASCLSPRRRCGETSSTSRWRANGWARPPHAARATGTRPRPAASSTFWRRRSSPVISAPAWDGKAPPPCRRPPICPAVSAWRSTTCGTPSAGGPPVALRHAQVRQRATDPPPARPAVPA